MDDQPQRIHEVRVSEFFGADLIQLTIGGFECVLSPELALEVADSLKRTVAIMPPPMPETAK